MLAFIGLSFGLFLGLAFFSAYMQREEIMANWSKYKSDPLYMFAAPMFKSDDDPRSRTQFAMDNFFDVIQSVIAGVFSVFLQPVFKIFQLFIDAIVQTLEGLFNIRMLLGNMWKKWNNVADVFMRRFYSVFHRLRVTFIKLFSSMEKSFGVAVSSIYTGLSTINTVLSFWDLMIKVVIIIFAILLALVIFFFYLLWPVMPIILIGAAVLTAAGLGAAAGSFCFAGDTPIITPAGNIPISEIKLDQELHDGATVKGIMMFNTDVDDLYELWGIQVSGTHIFFAEDGSPVHVKDHPDAKPMAPTTTKLYCLITSNRRIPVMSNRGAVEFADWEELNDDESLRRWHKEVFETLNPDTPYTAPTESALDSEAVLSPRSTIATPIGPAEIRGIRPGTFVIDVEGNPTRVTGVVCIAGSEIQKAMQISPTAYVAEGAWIKTGKEWQQPTNTVEHTEEMWYSLFTESGSFMLFEGMLPAMRDFTDVGATKIHKTYDWVLNTLNSYKS
jgi:hypothetical protein